MTEHMPRPTEMEATVVYLRRRVEELEARVLDLELRLAVGHDCLIDLCSLDSNGRCRLAPRDDDEDES